MILSRGSREESVFLTFSVLIYSLAGGLLAPATSHLSDLTSVITTSDHSQEKFSWHIVKMVQRILSISHWGFLSRTKCPELPRTFLALVLKVWCLGNPSVLRKPEQVVNLYNSKFFKCSGNILLLFTIIEGLRLSKVTCWFADIVW